MTEFHAGVPDSSWVQDHLRKAPDDLLTPDEVAEISRIMVANVERTGVLWIDPEKDRRHFRINGAEVSLGNIAVRCVSGQQEEAFWAVG